MDVDAVLDSMPSFRLCCSNFVHSYRSRWLVSSWFSYMVGLFCRWCSPGWFQRGRFVIGTIRGFIFLVYRFSMYWQVEVPSYVMDVGSFIACFPFSSSCVIDEILAKNLNRRFGRRWCSFGDFVFFFYLSIIARFWVDFDGALIALMELEYTATLCMSFV